MRNIDGKLYSDDNVRDQLERLGGFVRAPKNSDSESIVKSVREWLSERGILQSNQ